MITKGIPGEFAEYVLAFRGLVVGRVTIDVSAPSWIDGHHVIEYTSHGHTEGLITLLGEVRWDLVTAIDLDQAVAVEDREDTYLGPDGADHIVREHSAAEDNLQHDIQSAVAAIRGWPSHLGDRADFDLVFASRRLDLELWDAGRGYSTSSQVPSVRYDGVIDHDTGMRAWVSDDADRVPQEVRIASKYGEVTVELVEYRAPPT